MDAIIIEGLKVDTVIGCFNWERQIIQPLMLDLTIHNDLTQAACSDELDDTLNYAQICELASQVIQQAKPKPIFYMPCMAVKLTKPYSLLGQLKNLKCAELRKTWV